MKKTRGHHAWAIDTRSDEGHDLLGMYWGFNEDSRFEVVPIHMQGTRTALFRARQQARDALAIENKKRYVSFPNACVVKVKITLEWDR